MRKSVLALAVQSALLVGVSGVAAAQTATVPAPAKIQGATPTAAAVAQAVTDSAPAVTQDDSKAKTLEAVTVKATGYLKALDSAQRAKRSSAVVIEAITPEDLGKFTDNSIADQLQRVPGVQIDRGTDGRSGDHVSVRGIGAQYITTSINGRTPGGYGKEGQQFLRQFAVDVLPSEILSGARIYKSSSAEMVEAGLGGAVDFQTLHPLDYKLEDGKAYFGSVTAKAQLNQGAGSNDWGNSFSGIVGGHLADETFGFVVAGMKSRNPFQMDWSEGNSVNQHTLNVQNPDGTISHPSAIYYDNFTIGRTRREDQREAISVGLQWRPSAAWDINLDYLSSEYNRPDNRDTYVIDYSSGVAGTFLPGGITIEHGAVTAMDFTKYTPPTGSSAMPQVLGFPIGFNNDSKTQLGGLNVKWFGDRWTLDGDVSLNRTHTLQDLAWFYAARPYSSFDGINYTANDSGPPTFNAGAPAFSSPSDFNTIGALRRLFKTENDGGAASLSASFALSDQSTLKFGYRYSLTDVDVRNAYTVSFALTPEQLAMLDGTLYPGGTDRLLEGHNVGSFGTMPTQSPNSVDWDAFFPVIDLSKGPLGGSFPHASLTQGPWSSSTDPGIGYIYANKEKVHAAFAQFDFSTTLWGMPAEGNVGIRAVRTNERSRAFQAITTQHDAAGAQLTSQNFVPAETRSSYTNYLPSFNLTMHPDENSNLRFSLGQTMSRPEHLDMAPNNNLTVPSAALHQSNPNIVGTGSSGNANLKPATSWNFDTTFEHYNASGASYVASVFYKRVSDFIAPSVTLSTTLPGYGDQLFNLTQPQNYSNGHAYGAELGFNQPLRPLFTSLDGFGVQANYTYVDSKIDKPISGQKMTFPGVSKHNVNGTLYYSKDKLDARVAVVYRTAYLSQFPWAGYVAFPVSTEASLNVDMSISYQFTDKLGLTFTGSNLTREDRRDYLSNEAVFEHFYTGTRSFALALRAKF